MTSRRHVIAAGGALLAALLPQRAQAATAWRPLPQYLQPTTRLVPVAGGHALSLGWCGTKVALVQQALGLGGRSALYDSVTQAALRRVQTAHRLPATGITDAATWAALGIRTPWTIDAWRPAIRVPASASRAERIEAMLGYALAQVGSPYVWGGAGPKALGHDCSGLVLAAMAAAGLDPQPVTVTMHQSPGYVTTDHLYRHPRLERVPVVQRQRGDLVFWFGPDGHTAHVAFYLGGGRMVEAAGAATRVAPFRGDGPRRGLAAYVVRPFTARVR